MRRRITASVLLVPCRWKYASIIGFTCIICVLLGIAKLMDPHNDSESLNLRSARDYLTTENPHHEQMSTPEPTKSPIPSTTTACPESEIIPYTDAMSELSSLRDQFTFALTPWNIDGLNSNLTDPDVRWSMIVMVKSHSKNVCARRIARLTWAQQKRINGVRMKTIFIVGKAENPQAELELLEENKVFGDLLQLDREEKYADVVFKTLAGMQYAALHFPCDWIYSPADDDILPNFPKLHEKIENSLIDRNSIQSEPNGTCQANSSSLMIVCGYVCVRSAKPRRTKSDKWYVSRELYPQNWYPAYCMGAWYSMRVQHALELYVISRKHAIFWIDDVWITGTLRLKHVLNDRRYSCTPTDLTTGLATKHAGEEFVQTGNQNWLLSVARLRQHQYNP